MSYLSKVAKDTPVKQVIGSHFIHTYLLQVDYVETPGRVFHTSSSEIYQYFCGCLGGLEYYDVPPKQFAPSGNQKSKNYYNVWSFYVKKI